MQMQDRLVDLVEENKVLKQQILVLRDLEKKNASEIATLRTEVDSWKVQAFQMVSKTSEADEKSILESPEYRKLETELQQLRKLKAQYEKQISDQTQRLTEVERQLKVSQDKEKALYDAAEKKYRDEIAGLLQQLKDKDDEIKKHTLENSTLLDKNKEARARARVSQHAIEVLREHVEGQQNEINVLVERVSRQASLPSQTRSVTEIHDIEVFRKKFGLPPTEFCIATFSSTKLVLALVEIKALHKIKKGFIPGTGTVAEIVTRDGKRHELRGMMQRKEALLDIYRQMVKSNIPVKTYRDGKEETLKLS
ncbi:uncharacterized protein ACA1_050130 [Acanthamoeba castellanii str. Neff]|uniref:Uncharacterized protein n=1 Tax=Acanthamoeba castellanii (strain ATCC 30010 / Neff) TaxID=1257118 RepID=L8H5V2_ACACF|nr:uncharacterized protein ACA1_050130 [Acanthamoeba castellanii str. Neff]ELR19866.1 hypothetical protein ACA1_050130 [Acanthamoeba castellanii str. Neff]